MATKDDRNKIIWVNALNGALSGTTPKKGNIIKMSNALAYALTFALFTNVITDAGTVDGFSFKLQHSDTTADADFTDVDAEYIIGDLSDLTVTADTDDNKAIGSIGYRGNKEYVRIVGTGTTGTNVIVTIVAAKTQLSQSPPSAFVEADIAAT